MTPLLSMRLSAWLSFLLNDCCYGLCFVTIEQGALDVLRHLETALALNETEIAEAGIF